MPGERERPQPPPQTYNPPTSAHLQEMSPENSRDWKTGEKDPKITTTGAGSDDEEEADSSSDYESSADEKEGIPAPTISTSGAGGDGDEPNNESSTSGDEDDDDDIPSLVSESDDEDGGTDPIAFKVRFRTHKINIRRNRFNSEVN